MKLEFESNTFALPSVKDNFTGNVIAENDAAKISRMLQSGITAAQEGDRAEARQTLLQVTEIDPKNESAWLWMASISEYPEELLSFLNNVLSVNPHNERALEWAQATKSLLAKTFVERGIAAANNADQDLAKQNFWQAIVHDKANESAWEWLASVTDSIDEKISHLQKVLNLNPENEFAKNLLQELRSQSATALLRKANSAAVAGDRESAIEMLCEVLEQAPDLEEAWILKSYLAESFSEKIVCFEKVLSFNPDNEMAASGLASLREMMARNSAQKAQQTANLSLETDNSEAEIFVQSVIITDDDESPKNDELTITETEDEANCPTQELELPPGFVLIEENLYQPENFPTTEAERSVEPFENSMEEKLPTYQEENLPTYQEENLPTYQMETPAPAEEKIVEKSEEKIVETNSYKSSAETSVTCGFCEARNESNAFVCNSCKAILTLSNMEMLLANTEADQEVLRQAVGRMESEKDFRDFSANEYKTLAIGQINLKNLRQGAAHLQTASQMNPNDVVLSSQVNFLKIRLSEIEQQESVPNPLIGRTIMVVDDSATIRKLISGKLEKSGHIVVCATDGVDAMEKIKEVTPDLILLDIMMPQLDGYQVCKLIRTNESTKDVPIVMISGKDGFFDKVRGRMAGTTGYITKPFGPETLMKTLETYIVRRGEMSDPIED